MNKGHVWLLNHCQIYCDVCVCGEVWVAIAALLDGDPVMPRDRQGAGFSSSPLFAGHNGLVAVSIVRKGCVPEALFGPYWTALEREGF